tara:strand:+ start:51 stop:815 length:765 start_codon:yes stop_codon:yes gene_type:complete
MKNKDNHNQWGNKKDKYGQMFFQRAVGKLNEMESSKALAKIIYPLIKQNSKILDAGCGAGHYLRSILKLSNKDFQYYGIDLTQSYIDLAKKIKWKVKADFQKMNVEKLSFKKNTFDISICSNVLLHLENPNLALKKLVITTKKFLVIRTLISEKDYITKEVINIKNKNNFTNSIKPTDFIYYNSFSKKTLNFWINSAKKKCSIKFIKDQDFVANKIKQDSVYRQKKTSNTKILMNKQFNGPLMLNWYFVLIRIN